MWTARDGRAVTAGLNEQGRESNEGLPCPPRYQAAWACTPALSLRLANVSA
jgi:hypothetical protein